MLIENQEQVKKNALVEERVHQIRTLKSIPTHARA